MERGGLIASATEIANKTGSKAIDLIGDTVDYDSAPFKVAVFAGATTFVFLCTGLAVRRDREDQSKEQEKQD